MTGYQTGTKLWTGGDVAAAVEDYDASCDTEFGAQISEQAWSHGGQPPGSTHYHERHAWTTVLRAAGIGIGLAVAVGGLLLALVGPSHSAPDDHNSWPTGYTQTPIAMPPTKEAVAAPEPVWPPPPVGDAAHVTQDGQYLQLLLRAGIEATDAAAVVRDAHRMCVEMGIYGFSRYDEVLATERNVSWLTSDQAWAAVNAAADTYCPSYR